MLSFKIVTVFSLIVFNHALSMWHMSMASKHILYDMPVSNNGARCRVIIYKKQLQESDVSIVTPMELGGLKSEEFLKINPQGKMPTLQCTESGLSIPESDTISRYLLSHYAEVGPSFLPDNPKSNILCRFHDLYLASIQGALYKDRPPFSVYGSRKDALSEFCRQLQILDNMVDGNGPFLCGEEVSLADATIFPTMLFVMHMLPKFDLSHAIPSKLGTWFQGLKENDTVFKRVYTEISDGLSAWEDRGRWDTIRMAGIRDDAPATIFDKIISGDIKATIVKEDDKILAFKDINPASPAHVLVIPKDRQGLTNLRRATPEHLEILGRLLLAAGEIANDASLGFKDGARIVINDGPDGGQEIMHLHVHVLGGRAMAWPPG